jgi:hypothetical protein
MKDATEVKKVDIALYRKWSRRIALGAAVFLMPFMYALLYTLIDAVQRSESDRSALGEVAGSAIGLLVFMAVPLGLYTLIIKSWPSYLNRRQHPNEPWLWQSEWADGKIRYSRSSNAVGLWIGWVLLSGIGAGLVYVFAGFMTDYGFSPWWLYGTATAGSLWALTGALIETNRWRKFGTSYCHLVKNPGVLGGWLRVRLELPLALVHGDVVQVRLRLVFRGNKSGDSSRARTVWQIERTVPHEEMEIEANRRSFIPADLFIPKDIGVDMDPGSWGSHSWRLEANAKLAGLDYAAWFKVPVFITDESSENVPAEAIELFGEAVDTAKDFHAPEDIQVTPFDGGLEIRQVRPSRARRRIGCLGLLILSVGATAYFNLEAELPFMKPLAFPLAALIFLSWLHARYSRKAVLLTPDAVVRKSRIIFYERIKRVPIEDVREIWIESLQSPSGGETYRVDIKTKDSPPTNPNEGLPPDKLQGRWVINIGGITAANRLENKSQARWLKQLIESYLGKSKATSGDQP